MAELLEQMELAVRDLPPGRLMIFFFFKPCIFSTDRAKYDLRVRSYYSDKKQLDSELDKAVRRLRDAADRDELLAFDEAVQIDQQVSRNM